MLKRLQILLQRKRRSQKFGIPFNRAASWQPPENILIAGRKQPIQLPNDNGTKVAFINIFLDDCYGLEEIRTDTDIRTVLDIGAHAGMFSLYARACFPNAVIHAYEPNSFIESFLAHQSKIGKFAYFLEAVGKQDGRAQLAIDHKDSVQTRCTPNELGNIKQISFERCIERLGGSVDLLKLDCEGAEWEIFQQTTAWESVKHLVMEYHLTENHMQQEAIKRVQELGFRILKLTIDGPTWGILWATKKIG
ncbi:MAG TPA: FkbM family methyltransferase [Phormidium sp.]